MVYEYTIKHNGIVYPAGTDVPVGDEPKIEVKKVEKVEETPKPKAKAKPFKKTSKK